MSLVRRLTALCLLPLLAACAAPVSVSTPREAPRPVDLTVLPVVAVPAEALDLTGKARAFSRMVAQVEPVAERECRARAPDLDCDFRIIVDDRAGQPPNAYQTLDNAGRPVLAFTLGLIAEARNSDELAFVLSHEAAHHILYHLNRQNQNATMGAVVLGQLAAAMTGADENAVRTAQQLGAAVGARTYSKNYELEADRLGTIITQRAGYDPLRGAQFFTRIADPGNRFLGTHPPNADRIAIVRRTVERGY